MPEIDHAENPRRIGTRASNKTKHPAQIVEDAESLAREERRQAKRDADTRKTARAEAKAIRARVRIQDLEAQMAIDETTEDLAMGEPDDELEFRTLGAKNPSQCQGSTGSTGRNRDSGRAAAAASMEADLNVAEGTGRNTRHAVAADDSDSTEGPGRNTRRRAAASRRISEDDSDSTEGPGRNAHHAAAGPSRGDLEKVVRARALSHRSVTQAALHVRQVQVDSDVPSDCLRDIEDENAGSDVEESLRRLSKGSKRKPEGAETSTRTARLGDAETARRSLFIDPKKEVASTRKLVVPLPVVLVAMRTATGDVVSEELEANAFRMADDEFEDAVAGDMSIDVGDAAIGEELSKGATGAYSAPIRGRKQEDGAISATTAGTQARGGASSLSWHKSVSVLPNMESNVYQKSRNVKCFVSTSKAGLRTEGGGASSVSQRSSSSVGITSTSESDNLRKRPKTVRDRRINSELPPDILQSWRTFIPTYIKLAGSTQDPWSGHTVIGLSRIQKAFNLIYPETSRTLTSKDAVLALANQRLSDSWRTALKMAAVKAIARYWESDSKYSDRSQRAKFVEHILGDGLPFVWEKWEPDPKARVGPFRSTFIIETFAAHFTATRGAIDLNDIYSDFESESSAEGGERKPAAALALSAVAVESAFEAFKASNGSVMTKNEGFMQTKWGTKTGHYLQSINRLKESHWRKILARAQAFSESTAGSSRGQVAESTTGDLLDPRACLIDGVDSESESD